MIDHDDSNQMWLIAMLTDGPWWFVLILVAGAIYFSYQVGSNEEKCKQKICLPPMSSKLIKHECLCVTKPVEE